MMQPNVDHQGALFQMLNNIKERVHLMINIGLHRTVVQKDLKILCNWSENLQMLFNIDKCTVLHIGTNIRHIDLKEKN